MKIAVCSDLHLEFGGFSTDDAILTNPEQADVLVLSGDVCVAKDLHLESVNKGGRITSFFEAVSKAYKHVVYIMGNHEHYNGDYALSAGRIYALVCQYDNFHFLDNESIEIDGTLFVGGTMWTDMNGEDPSTMYFIKHRMNDFRIIRNSNRQVCRTVPIYEYNDDGGLKKDEKGYNIQIGTKKKEEPSTFSPEDAVDAYKKFMEFLKQQLSETKCDKVVVCTHHTPSHQSCHPAYAHDHDMNGGYHNKLDFFIEDNPKIKLWTHGHTHERFDYTIGETRVVCNPRGYIKYERCADTFVPKVVEL